MPRVLAVVTSAPGGTEYREDAQSQWEDASVGDKLYEDYEIRNTQGEYGVEMDYEVEITFPDGAAVLTFGKIQGEAIYLNTSQKWVKAPSGQGVEALAVHSAKSSTVPMAIRGTRGGIKPKPWGQGG